MTNIKLKAVRPEYSFITMGKIYPVEKIDKDGDYVIYDEDGDAYYVKPCNIGKNQEWEKVSGLGKYDLLNGDIVVNRLGFKYIFFKNYAGYGDTFVNVDGGWMPLSDYDDMLLKSDGDDGFDIMEVYRPSHRGVIYKNTTQLDYYYCVFKRDDRKKMTVEDIEAALGYKIEVIDNE